MTLSKSFLAAALVAALGAGPVLAQAPATTAAPAATTAPAAPSATAAPSAAASAKQTRVDERRTARRTARTQASLACSKDADSKNLHGKPRKSFMSDCKKAGGPK